MASVLHGTMIFVGFATYQPREMFMFRKVVPSCTRTDCANTLKLNYRLSKNKNKLYQCDKKKYGLPGQLNSVAVGMAGRKNITMNDDFKISNLICKKENLFNFFNSNSIGTKSVEKSRPALFRGSSNCCLSAVVSRT